MTTNTISHDSTAQHGHDKDLLVELALQLKVIDAGHDDLDTVIDHENEVEVRMAYKTEIDIDSYEITVTRDDEHNITPDFSIPAVPDLTDRMKDQIRLTWAHAILDGKIPTNRTWLFSEDLEEAFDAAEAKMIHPAGCANDGNCWARMAGVEIEHSSTTEMMTSDSFNAEGVLEFITDQLDYRNDVYRVEKPMVIVQYPGKRDAAWITGTPADLRALGHFLIEQSDRFEKMLDGAVEVAL